MQIGYQQESPSVRNSFLAAAYGLRNGIVKGATPKTASPDMIRAMSTGLWLDYLSIRLDGSKVTGGTGKINLITPDTGEKYVVELSNETLTNIQGYQAKDADLTITIDRQDLVPIMMGVKTFDDQLKAGRAKFKGDRKIFDQLRTAMTTFDLYFEMMPGTAGIKPAKPETKPLQVEEHGIGPSYD